MLLLFDIGGTHMRFSFSDGRKLGEVMILPTPRSYKDALDTFRGVMAACPPGQKVTRAIGGVPLMALNKPTYWWTHPAAKHIQKIVKAPVELYNDAALGALGEAVVGAGKKHKIIGYLTFGTGFGGARVVNGKADPSHFGFEPRMQIADVDHESYPPISLRVSGRGLRSLFKRSAREIARKTVWHGVERWIGIAANNAAAFWSPSVIILNGAIIENKNVSVSKIQKFVKQRFRQMPGYPKVVRAKLGQLSGLYGALVKSQE